MSKSKIELEFYCLSYQQINRHKLSTLDEIHRVHFTIIFVSPHVRCCLFLSPAHWLHADTHSTLREFEYHTHTHSRYHTDNNKNTCSPKRLLIKKHIAFYSSFCNTYSLSWLPLIMLVRLLNPLCLQNRARKDYHRK